MAEQQKVNEMIIHGSGNVSSELVEQLQRLNCYATWQLVNEGKGNLIPNTLLKEIYVQVAVVQASQTALMEILLSNKEMQEIFKNADMTPKIIAAIKERIQAGERAYGLHVGVSSVTVLDANTNGRDTNYSEEGLDGEDKG